MRQDMYKELFDTYMTERYGAAWKAIFPKDTIEAIQEVFVEGIKAYRHLVRQSITQTIIELTE